MAISKRHIYDLIVEGVSCHGHANVLNSGIENVRGDVARSDRVRAIG